VYQEFEGFVQPVDQCRAYDDLPPAAREYVEFIERFVGVPVRLVCAGRRRDQILSR
jgi:adenylosuccinate synthase